VIIKRVDILPSLRLSAVEQCEVFLLQHSLPVRTSGTADVQQMAQVEQLLIHILVPDLMRNSNTSIRSPAALRLSYGVPTEVAPYLEVRMKLSMPESIYCAGRKYDRQVDRKAAALCMKFTV
jgi:hypothetical protein